MRALTVQQPWAWAIIHGGKDVENRTQVWSHRGPLAIHAGARFSDRSNDALVDALASAMREDRWQDLVYDAMSLWDARDEWWPGASVLRRVRRSWPDQVGEWEPVEEARGE